MIPVRRQISRFCELSCDEAVIRNMDDIQKQSYGETLLSMAGEKRLFAGILATTLCEEKKELKERLLSIMKYKKQTSGMLFLSVIIVVLLTGCGTMLGSVSKKDTSSRSTQGENTDNDIEDMKSENEFKWYGETSLISDDIVFPNTLIKTDNAMNDFLESDKTIALLAANTKENIYIYGLKENGSSSGDFLYRLRGICIRQGNEIHVLDIDWGIYGDIPQIQYEDYDNDGQKELAMILRSAQGTDLSLLDLHILEKSDNGGFTDNRFTDWADQLSKLVTHEVSNGILKLFVKGEQIAEINILALEEEWGEKFETVILGNNVKFLFINGKLYLQTLPMAAVSGWVTPQEITDVYIQMEVQYNGEFELSEASAVFSASADTVTSTETDANNIDTEKVEDVIGDNSISESNDIKVEDIADEAIEKYLDGSNGKLLKQTTDGFVKAYFTDNEEEMKKYLSKDFGKLYSHGDKLGSGKNEYNKLTHLVAKWYSATDEKAEVQYEFQVDGGYDSYTYLGILLEYSDGQFHVLDFYLEA